MTTILKGAALTCCVFFVVGNVVPANELTGTVRDVCGPVLPGTAVSVANGSGAAARVAADGNGRYSLSEPSIFFLKSADIGIGTPLLPWPGGSMRMRA